MKPNLLFEPDVYVPVSDFKLFKSCNSAAKNWKYKPAFYQLKDKLLRMFGVACGHDLQVIKHVCYTCGGSGMYTSDRVCYNCTDGVHQVVNVCLERWVLNGELFHIPLGRVDIRTGMLWADVSRPREATDKIYTFKNTIQGLVTHLTPAVNPDYAYICLLYKYDRDGFFAHLLQLQKSLSAADWKKWGELSAGRLNFFEVLQEWFIGPQEEEDDLPF